VGKAACRGKAFPRRPFFTPAAQGQEPSSVLAGVPYHYYGEDKPRLFQLRLDHLGINEFIIPE